MCNGVKEMGFGAERFTCDAATDPMISEAGKAI